MKQNVGPAGLFPFSISHTSSVPSREVCLSASRLETLKSVLHLVVLEVGIGGGWPPLSLCWHSKWSGEKFQNGFFLGAELDRKTRRQNRRKSFLSINVPQ